MKKDVECIEWGPEADCSGSSRTIQHLIFPPITTVPVGWVKLWSSYVCGQETDRKLGELN